MERKYECIGLCPLAFPDGQEVESGETFVRDFAKFPDGVAHERFLIRAGHIRVVMEPTPAAPKKEVKANGVPGSH